ncbi:MAG: PD-(D/E)XK nuclease domain-containing protein [Lachnospiraceae bacterium]
MQSRDFYHGMILGMFSDVYIIISNREAGEGRFDIQLEPRDKSKPGYLLEFKNSKLNRKILSIS